jgi:Holliday junction resolvase RusA-like endonuclease
MTITFDVPLPPRACSSNGSHGHWRKKSAAAKQYRKDVGWDAMVARADAVPERMKRRVSLVFGIKGGRKAALYQPRDVPNAVSAFKAGFDGLTDAGLLVDDSRTWMELGEVKIDPNHGPWVRVTVEEAK